MLSWTRLAFRGDRRVASTGRVEIGAVFPPHSEREKWRWRFWLTSIGQDGSAKTELAARNALETVWADFLAQAGLTPADAPASLNQPENDVLISQEVMAVLDRADIGGNTLSLAPVGVLDKKLYAAVNAVLEAAGGKWNRKAKAHVFDGDAADIMDPIIATGEYRRVKQDMGQFDTPDDIAALVIERADIQPSMIALEPSAGLGNLARPAIAAGATVTMWELDAKRATALHAAGIGEVINGDFLDATPAPVFDVVVMNPPFAKFADIQHVTHAVAFLKPGGRMVAIMSAGVKFRQGRLMDAFRALVERSGGTIEDLPEGAFISAGTGVRACLVTFKKATD